MIEIWKDVPGYFGKYQVSNKGSVRSMFFIKSKRKIPLIMKTFNDRGYHGLSLCYEGKVYHEFVHQLVAKSFLGFPEKNKQVGHGNGNRGDNRLENLRWVTAKENSEDRDLHGRTLRGSKIGNSKLTEKDIIKIRKMLDRGFMGKHIAAVFGVTPANVSHIKTKKWWRHLQ